jgi:transposase
MSNDESAVPRLVAIDRRQLFLRAVDVEKLVEEDHCVRSIWELVGRLDLRLYYAQIAAVEGGAGREHTDPQLLISLWLYAYSRGISSARELAAVRIRTGLPMAVRVAACESSHFVGVPLRE